MVLQEMVQNRFSAQVSYKICTFDNNKFCIYCQTRITKSATKDFINVNGAKDFRPPKSGTSTPIDTMQFGPKKTIFLIYSVAALHVGKDWLKPPQSKGI